MFDNNILLVAPYHELEILTRKFNEKSPVKLSVIQGNMNQNIDRVNYAIENGVKIVLSRWGTCEYLKRKISVPVIDISATTEDIFMAVSRVISRGYKKIAVVNVSDINERKREYLNKFVGVNLKFFLCHRAQEVRDKVKHLAEKGEVEAVVGDVTAVSQARKLGMYAELLESGEESILKALSLCTNILDYREEQTQILLGKIDTNRKNLSDVLRCNAYEEIPADVHKGHVDGVLVIDHKSTNSGFSAKYRFSDIVGQEDIKIQAEKFAKSNENILIFGETGTGKELFAQSIHNKSRRLREAFVSVNCASLTESLIESEMFGYEDGAFTGALKKGKKGLFELADKGTIFLDEIGEISLEFQAKLLRVIQEREIRRVGGVKNISVDVRVICATNKNLKEECEKGTFRWDLYYRINVLELRLKPLRFRKKDIIPLFMYFLKRQCVVENKRMIWKDDRVFEPILQYKWQGNVRELENFAKFVVAYSDKECIDREFMMEMMNLRNPRIKDEINIEFSYDLKDIEHQVFSSILDRYGGNKERLCRDFNISKTTLWRKLNSI